MNVTIDDDLIYTDTQTNQIVAIFLPIIIGVVGITYFCCKYKCIRKIKKQEQSAPTSSTAPLVIQV
jgi:hypothetical protein